MSEADQLAIRYCRELDAGHAIAARQIHEELAPVLREIGATGSLSALMFAGLPGSLWVEATPHGDEIRRGENIFDQ